jgi:hypothetical protein
MYIFLNCDPPQNKEDVVRWLSVQLRPNDYMVGIQIFYNKNIEWILTHSFFKSFIYHGVYFSQQLNKYAFHAIIIEDFKKDPNDYAYNKLSSFPNVGMFDTWDKMLDGTAIYLSSMWGLL